MAKRLVKLFQSLGPRDFHWQRIVDGIVTFIQLLWITRASLLALTLAVFALGTDQFGDALRAVSERGFEQPWLFVCLVGSALLLAWNFWFWTPLPVVQSARAIQPTRFLRFFQNHSGGLYGVVFLFVIAACVWQTILPESLHKNALVTTTCVLRGLAALFFFAAIIHACLWLKQLGPETHRCCAAREWRYGIFMCAVWGAMLTLFVVESQWAIYMGPTALVVATIAVWLPLLTGIVLLERRLRFPVSLVILLWAFVLSLFDWNDNTELRHKITVQSQGNEVLAHAFTAWLKSRPDLEDYPNGYPVFIVSAEGGGIRSAYLTAIVLSRLQDHEPRFAHHIFAMSGVSGGSVGAAVFVALCDLKVPPGKIDSSHLTWEKEGELERLADRILSRDLLSPVLAASLHPNLVQQIIPFPVPGTDPARSLEFGLETAWKEATRKDFPQSFYSLSQNFGKKSTPALFLNTTSVETGERMVIASLYPLEGNQRFFTFADEAPFLDLPLSTAAVLSARFPGVTPSGFVVGERGQDAQILTKDRFVDGGYYENSGCATAIDIVNALRHGQRVEGRPKFCPVVIRIGYEVGSLNGRSSDRPREPMGLEDASPLKVMFRTRNGRASDATQQLRAVMDDIYDRDERLERLSDDGMIEFVFRGDKLPIPLGWMISDSSRHAIKEQISNPEDKNGWYRGYTKVAIHQVLSRLNVKTEQP